jgi:LysM repeat protein
MARTLRIVILAGLLLMLLSTLPGSVSAQTFSAYDVIAAVNNLRAQYGLEPYQVDGGLMSYSQQHSEYQASIGTSTHTHSDGTTPRSYGVTENIASGSASILTMDFIMRQIWSDSLHMNTMIGYDSGYAGAGIAVSGGTVYVTLDVRPGKSAGAPPSGSGSTGSAPAATQIALVPLTTATPNANGSIVHEVGYGQSLWSIAIAYGTKIDEIRNLNGLPAGSTDIYAGQRLVVRPAGAYEAPSGLTPTEPETLDTPLSTSPAPTLTPTTGSAASITPADTPTATPGPTRAPLINTAGSLSTRLLALALILIGVLGVVWVVRSGFLGSEKTGE